MSWCDRQPVARHMAITISGQRVGLALTVGRPSGAEEPGWGVNGLVETASPSDLFAGHPASHEIGVAVVKPVDAPGVVQIKVLLY